METTAISVIDSLIREMDEQAAITKNFLTLVPEDKFEWAPHEKSMKMKALATHIAELPAWTSMAVTTEELDFLKNPYKTEPIESQSDLISYFERSYANGRSHLEKTNEEILSENWTLRSGDTIHSLSTKLEVIRMSFNQIVHHRAQLGVYFRLLGIAVPQSFGPTADSVNF